MPHIRKLKPLNSSPSRVVCVGASAGGLEALIDFFKFIPGNTPMAFVLIQHLEPLHKSALPEILSRETSLNIREARHHTKVSAGDVYVITPNTLMTISKGRLKITSRTRRKDGRYLPIDFFMVSLAKDQGKKAAGVILSGTGSDGTLGAAAIKEKGGIVFAQDQKTAGYSGMPESVIKSGTADFILSPPDIARKLIHSRTHIGIRPLKRAAGNVNEADGLRCILVLLRDLTGVDFVHYKQTTVSRRIARRMSFYHLKSYQDYRRYLEKNPSEADVLRREILIPVTYFFRDPGIFAVLRKKVFPLLVNKRTAENPIRLWVPACSSGEEVYSLAMSLYEFLEEKKIKPRLQIFGTDLSEAVIEKARAGLYSEDISVHVPPGRLGRFFMKTETGYKIAKPVRDLCIFAKHDLTGDPPLSNMDIVSCRNVLIYLDAFLQKKALSLLNYALKPGGFLVLGPAESVSAVPGLFTAIDQKQKIYAKNAVPGHASARIETPGAAFTASGIRAPEAVGKPGRRCELDKQRMDARLRKAKIANRRGLRFGESTDTVTRDILGDTAKLRKEFVRTVERLNAVSEEKDAFNEELKAANEEIQSSNEELQSTNEELETSKEELQSTNEELLTLNEELQNKNEELTHLNSDLNNVFASTNIPMIIVGNDLCIKRFTPTARKAMNLIPTDAGRPIGDIQLNVNITGLEELIAGVIEDMAPRQLEVKDREGRWYSVCLRPYRTVDNRIDGAVITMLDIDKQKIADEILKRESKSLKKMVKKKSHQLLDLGARMERSKYLSGVGTLAATVAHELRNTLAAINLAVYNIRKKVKNPQVQGNLSSIDKMVIEGDHIINNVLSYSKIKTSHFQKVKINDVLEACAREAESRVLGQEIRIDIRMDATKDLWIQADPTQIKELFANLLNNALDAVEKKSGSVGIASQIRKSGILVRITDDGEGIAGEDLKKVLEPFFTTKAKGTGLGLAVCNQIVLLHAGSIHIQSIKGKGTTVEIALPVKRDKNV